jgi:hypothetical protein
MSKMNETDLRRRLDLLSEIKPSPQATARALDRVRRTLVQVNKQSDARPASLWRIIMKSRITRPAAAAVVILAVVLAMMSDWMGITTPAFGLEEISKAMKQVEHGHLVWKVEESNLDAETAKKMNLGGRESWSSRHPPRQIEKRDDGTITCTEEDTGLVSRYDPASHVIVVERGTATSAEDLQMNAFDRFTKELVELKQRGAKVEYGKGVYEGRPVTTITVDYTPGRMRSVFSLMVDPDTYLLCRLTLEQTIADKGWRVLVSAVADYPDSGPTDIYEAGAPRDAEVLAADPAIRSGPDVQSLKLLAQYDAAREHLPKQWILVAVRTEADDTIRDVAIVHADHQKERWEHRSGPSGRTGTSADAIPVSQGFKAILEWARSRECSRLVKSICDGKYKQSVSYYDGAWHVGDKEAVDPKYGFSGEGLYYLGWPLAAGRIVENVYASQRGLFCIEIFGRANVQQGKLMEPARRTLYYIDPSRDHMCVRREVYAYDVPADRRQAKVNEVEFNPYTTPSEPTSIRDVVEFGRLDTGQLYPSRLREGRAVRDDATGQWEPGPQASSIRVYIQTSPEFAPGVFDLDDPGWLP